jgi:hypothetical protein
MVSIRSVLAILPVLAFLLAAGSPDASVEAQARRRKKPTPTPAPTPEPLKGFKVEIEQAGVELPVQDHEVYLRREPFSILVSSGDLKGVFVSASFAPGLYDDARAGKPFGSNFRSTIVVAESPNNKGKDLVTDDNGPAIHYWDNDPDFVKFDEALPLGPGFRGRRTVSSFFVRGQAKAVDQTFRPALYLVFVRGEASASGDHTIDAGVRTGFSVLLDPAREIAEREVALQQLGKLGKDAILALDVLGREERMRANEAVALSDIRTVITSQAAYAYANGGLFDALDCLETPSGCLPNYAAGAPPFLSGEPLMGSRAGYLRTFQPGPPANRDQIKKAKGSPTSLTAFAITAVPERPGQDGLRAFCGDATGRICVNEDGDAPRAEDGQCSDPCREPR